MKLSQFFADAIIAHALEDYPNECCGILAGRHDQIVKIYRMRNTENSPYRYNMDSQELFQTYRDIENQEWDLSAIYHSHTNSEAYPSPTDIRLATWPGAVYLLVSLAEKERPVLRGFRISNQSVTEEEIDLSKT